MKHWLQKRLRYLCSNRKWFRKWYGGYWEQWYIDCFHCDIWFDIDKKSALNGIINDEAKFRPGCGFGTPYCEYYPIQYFGSKLKLNDEIVTQLERQEKLKRITKNDK